MTETLHTCTKCGVDQPDANFPRSKGSKRNRAGDCKSCRRLYMQDWHRRRLYGISLEQYMEMFDRQKGLCACCGDPPGEKALSVDHDHITGQVRDLLCQRCNPGIGYFQDDPERLQKAIDYLQKWSN